MDWNCTLTEERLSDVLDGALPPELSAAFSAHAGECERCTKLLAQIGGIVSQVQQLPSIEEPPFLASRIIAATRGTPARAGKSWLAWSPAIWQTRFAMGIVTVAATFLIVLHAVNAGTPGKLQLSPTSLYHEVNRRAHRRVRNSVTAFFATATTGACFGANTSASTGTTRGPAGLLRASQNADNSAKHSSSIHKWD